MEIKKDIIIVHSGGMDSSLCLAWAVKNFGVNNVLSLSFNYGQRHSIELIQAKKISAHLGVENVVLDITCLGQITQNSLTNHQLDIEHIQGEAPNTLVSGRNGLMARIAGIHANSLGAHKIAMGIIEVESANSGYRDCSRSYMDLMQNILRLDFNDPNFEIVTPLVFMTKKETMEFGHKLGVLEYLLEETVTCYRGVPKEGCGQCPSCKLRREGIQDFLKIHPEINFSYKNLIT